MGGYGQVHSTDVSPRSAAMGRAQQPQEEVCMRFKAAVLGAALLMLGAGAASAGSNYVGLNGRAGLPMGDYGDVAGTGWNLGASGKHYINDMWGFGADLGYHGWGASDDLESSLPSGDKVSFTALQATAHAVMAF